MEMLLTIFDYVVGGLFIFNFLIGLKRGLLFEAISSIAWFSGIVAAVLFNDGLSAFFINYFKNLHLASMVGFMVLVMTPLIIATIFSYILAFIMVQRSFNLAFSSRLLGGALGILRSVMVVFVLTFFLFNTPLKTKPWFETSYALNRLTPTIKWLQSHVVTVAVDEALKKSPTLQDKTESPISSEKTK
jgi:uncharacterized membrane protein required for colicin V production